MNNKLDYEVEENIDNLIDNPYTIANALIWLATLLAIYSPTDIE